MASRQKLEAVAAPLTRPQGLWLLAMNVACWLPMVPHLPEWLAGLSALLLLWSAWLRASREATSLLPLPDRRLLMVLTLGGTLAIAAYYQTLFGRSAGVALLTLLASLKLLEVRSKRDALVLVLLCCFLLLSQFIYIQDIARILTLLLGGVLVTAALAILEYPAHRPRALLRLSGLLLLQSLPMMLLLFVLFPRIHTPLWGLPADAFSAHTGLSDSMSPGAISLLSQSDAIAFRVQFARDASGGAVPPQPLRYWRGPVLVDFDGRTWRMASTPQTVRSLPYVSLGQTLSYAVTLEPHNRQWLFALERLSLMPAETSMTTDYQLLTKEPVRGRQRFELHSTLAWRERDVQALSALERQATLQLPALGNPRSRALAQAWRKEAGAAGAADAAIVRRLLEHFRQERFFYTLRPPLLGEDGIDDFLFMTRRGFCEHYAAAFVFVMRAAGIPARVVTGYQGGEVNPVDGVLVVRQSDAHAWAEVWLAGQGWQRVDPTAAIAPARVELGLSRALAEDEPLPLLARAEFGWLQGARYRWEAVANAWNQWVIGYDQQRQRNLLQRLGLSTPDWQHLAALFATLCGGLLLAMTALALYQRSTRDPLAVAWQRLSDRLGRLDVARHPWEGPESYMMRIRQSLPGRPALLDEVQTIVALYIRLRYARPDSVLAPARPADLKTLQRRIRRLDLNR